MVAIVSHKREAIQRAVREMYTAVAARPQEKFHFPTGRAACEAVGYPAGLLDGIPERALESFAGVGCPFAADVIREGDRVLDVGSGSGSDALICARLVGPGGRVYALDMTPRMREKLARTAAEAGVRQLEVLAGEAEAIPLPDASVDVVTTNGVLNLVPDKARAIAEIHRVLKPGGRLQVSDIALTQPVADRFRQDPQMWAECVVGAVEEERYLAMLRSAGFEQIERLGDLDYFGLSNSEKTREVAGLFNAHSVTLRARKPVHATQAAPVPSARRALVSLFNELGGVAGAVLAWLACAGVPALVAALGALGAGEFASHAYLIPVYAAFLGLSTWLLWRSGRARREFGPFWLALAGSSFAIVTTWLAVVRIAPWLGWWSYAGVAGVVAASLWSYLLGRRPETCLQELRFEASRRTLQRPAAQRVAFHATSVLAIAAALYGLYLSVDAFAGYY